MNGAVFIETRDTPGLAAKFEAHLKFVPDLQPLVICSEQNKYQFNGFEKVVIKPINNIIEYNFMMTSTQFWDLIPFEKILTCEHESGILREGLDEFIEWDYVGAPWWFQKYGGNGGFSWRSVKAMKDICKAYSYTGKGQEDTYFCNVMNQSKYFRLAPRKVCERFSVETVYKLGSFGYHFGKDAKLMLRPWEMDKILQQYD